jgi:superfamily I DNA/RNA helicase
LSNYNKDIKIFPNLSEVIKEDAIVLLNKEIDFEHIFHNMDENNKYIKFYKKRKDYYKGYYGYSDIIFAAVKYLEKYKNKIPTYEQIVVDEFQDFNKLEVALIDLLSEKNPILLAGDDDQALYDFKSASTKYIRDKHAIVNKDYASFRLPFCSRCTRVIVDAANDIIKIAIKNGFLEKRINKPYHYFEDKKKDRDSIKYPTIYYTQKFSRQIPWVIAREINNIAKEIRKNFSVLIISPTRRHTRYIVNALIDKGFKNIEFVERTSLKEPILTDGLKILLDDDKSNLGWRIVAKSLLEKNDFDSLIKETDNNQAKLILDILDKDCKADVIKMLKILKAIKKGAVIERETIDSFLKKISYDHYADVISFLKNQFYTDSQYFINPGIRKISIKCSTIQGSKGLASDYVFITHFDNQYFIKNKDKKKISNQDICNFLVALTRAKRKVFLISSNNQQEPTFLNWINKKRIEKQTN